MCQKGCRDLANFCFNYYLFINHYDDNVEPELKRIMPWKIFGLTVGELFGLVVIAPIALLMAVTVPALLLGWQRKILEDRLNDTENRYLRGDGES